MKHKKPEIEFRCEKCGALQPRNESRSSENWNVFDCKQKCKCGGNFVMYFDGDPLGTAQAGEEANEH